MTTGCPSTSKVLSRPAYESSHKAREKRNFDALRKFQADSNPLISMSRASMYRLMLNLRSKVDDVVRHGRGILLSDGDLDVVAVGGAYKVLLSVKCHSKNDSLKRASL